MIRLRGPSLETMDFVSFRADLAGAIGCGTQSPANPVLVTYRPSADEVSAGEVVVVEFVPPGFRPRG
ncbi:MAG: hypothetical protein R2712_16880 [Vicinamibacterales bacterium]